ncbi:amidohydrolase family protein [Propionivibrio dicarboxylicus]|uniref:Aminocarboxymuconate-semialdehyde decarboxylase n=1 Tax=Propionivibrio dicarboxylicus TaxID=83767 RepID=A0A1G8NS81_9RHOO|nr:amidohydrolase family protein [Propionivibrio dicarboxylicus]SDI83017.1 aminocarboxymuconate-semialdehyde decarboxylase [Propionivibrio dicarboxylicus]
MKLDIYTHIFPSAYFAKLNEIITDKAKLKRWFNLDTLYDLKARFEIMDRYPDYAQVLSLSPPPLEALAGPDQTPEMARIANDGLAELVDQYPDRFPAWVASLPMNNVAASLEEIERAFAMGAVGVQLFTNIKGLPLDHPDFEPVLDLIVGKHGKPIWLHPARTAQFSDYASEKKSKYEIWWTFGWPYETSAAMARLVFSGFFERYPDMRVIAHHSGAMIPFFDGRVGHGWDELGSRTDDEDYESILKRMPQRPIDYFRQFYTDTAVLGSRSAIRCGIDFFGASQRTLFGTDFPFDKERGELVIRDTIAAIDSLDISESDRTRIYYENAKKLLNLQNKKQ